MIDAARQRHGAHAGRCAAPERCDRAAARRRHGAAAATAASRCPAFGSHPAEDAGAGGIPRARSRENDIVVGIGPAGTGKTYLAVAAAVDALTRKRVRRIVLARPAVEAGESLGFLPGDMQAKVDPYLRPLYDALDEMMPRRADAEGARDAHDRDRAARVHARAHAWRRVRDPRRSAERDRDADEDVPDAARRELADRHHGRQDADRPAEARGIGADADRAHPPGHRRHRVPLLRRDATSCAIGWCATSSRRTPRTAAIERHGGEVERRRRRRGSPRKRAFAIPCPRGSRSASRGVTYIVFPASPAVDSPILEVGSVATGQRDRAVRVYAFSKPTEELRSRTRRRSSAASSRCTAFVPAGRLDSARSSQLTGFSRRIESAAASNQQAVVIQQWGSGSAFSATVPEAHYLAVHRASRES